MAGSTPTCAVEMEHPRDRAWPEEIDTILSSPPVHARRTVLRNVGQEIEPVPILCKTLPGPSLRVMFPVSGDRIERGVIVSVVVLYDLKQSRTLYAHPMHAGPDVNPLLKHLDGPMNGPKSQPGADGDRATRRILEHKRALWERFLSERETLGILEASRRWRSGYFWALRRLYFCTKCTQCKWGHPYFDERHQTVDVPAQRPDSDLWTPHPLSAEQCEIVERIVASEAWQTEAAYGRRGDFSARTLPRLLQDLDDSHVQAIFPMEDTLLQGGSLVALSTIYHRKSARVIYAHCLSCGPEAEIVFLRGDTALGIPPPRAAHAVQSARQTYIDWRKNGWIQFWLDELEWGLSVASARWRESFWLAIENLFGGNLLCERNNAQPGEPLTVNGGQ
ncbi:MAG: hypothetical protein ACE5EQ_01390 [Phycisphaerae bacterium]